jgi:molybdopterin molybdotransferase
MADAHTPFKSHTSLAAARERLRTAVDAHGRTETVELAAADSRIVAETVTAGRNVPQHPRAAMDGYAVRAADTFGAGDRSPRTLQTADPPVTSGECTQVHTGSALPEGADAVVMIEDVDVIEDEIEVFRPVGERANVAPVGEDVECGQTLFEPGRRLSPPDLGLLRSVGRETVPVFERPTVAVVPTGEELVETAPDRGETVETNGLTVARFARRWGGEPLRHDIVPDDEMELADTISEALDVDIVVTTGGSSVGERDLLPAVVSELGELRFHGVGIKPGHPVALGVVENTPVVLLPGYPVSCLVNAVQFLRPALTWSAGASLDPLPTVDARLSEKIHSEPGVRSFVRVGTETDGDERVASVVRAGGASVLSSVTRADGWVVVSEQSEGIAAGESVTVERWGWTP